MLTHVLFFIYSVRSSHTEIIQSEEASPKRTGKYSASIGPQTFLENFHMIHGAQGEFILKIPHHIFVDLLRQSLLEVHIDCCNGTCRYDMYFHSLVRVKGRHQEGLYTQSAFHINLEVFSLFNIHAF